MSEVIWAVDGIKSPIRKKTKESRSFCTQWKVLSACVLTSVCSVCCVIFMWVSLNKMEQIRKEIRTLSQRSHAKITPATSRTLQNENDSTNDSNKRNHEEEKFRNGSLSCILWGGCHRNDDLLSDNSDALDVNVQQSLIMAVHYVPSSVNGAKIHEEFKNNAMCISKWNGVMCRNNTFKNKDPNQIIEFWIKAPWVKTHTRDVLSLGANPSAPGIFRVEIGGLYLLYLNVLISATSSKHDVGLYISDNKKLVCRENLDFVRGASSRFSNPKAKTCSISGAFYIEQNQTMSVKLVTRNTAIYLDSYNTNFGAVLLA